MSNLGYYNGENRRLKCSGCKFASYYINHVGPQLLALYGLAVRVQSGHPPAVIPLRQYPGGNDPFVSLDSNNIKMYWPDLPVTLYDELLPQHPGALAESTRWATA